MTREEAHKLVDELFEAAGAGGHAITFDAATAEVIEEPARVLPEGKRAVRTKNSGNTVYLLDEVKKFRHRVMSPEALQYAGFEMTDVVEIEDTELYKYTMATALFKTKD